MVRANLMKKGTATGAALKPFEAIAQDFKKALTIWKKCQKQRAKLNDNPNNQMAKNLLANEHVGLWNLLAVLDDLVVNYNMKRDPEVEANAAAYSEMMRSMIAEKDDEVVQNCILEAEAPIPKQQIAYNIMKYLDLLKEKKTMQRQMTALDAIAAIEDDHTDTHAAAKQVESIDVEAEKEEAVAVPLDHETNAANVNAATNQSDRTSQVTQRLSMAMPTHDGLGAAWEDSAQPMADHEDKPTQRVIWQDCIVIEHPKLDKLEKEMSEMLQANLRTLMEAKQVKVVSTRGLTLVEVADAVEKVTPLNLRDHLLTCVPEGTIPVPFTMRDCFRPRFYAKMPRELTLAELDAYKAAMMTAMDGIDATVDITGDILAITVYEPRNPDIKEVAKALPADAKPTTVSSGHAVERYSCTVSAAPARHAQELMLMRNKVKQEMSCKDCRVLPRESRLHVEIIGAYLATPTLDEIKKVMETITPVEKVVHSECVLFQQGVAGDEAAQPLTSAEIASVQKYCTENQGPQRVMSVKDSEGWTQVDIMYPDFDPQSMTMIKDKATNGIIAGAMKALGKTMGDSYSTFSLLEDAPRRQTRVSRATQLKFQPNSRVSGDDNPPLPRQTAGDGVQNFDKLIEDEHNLQGRISIALPVYGYDVEKLGYNAKVDGQNLFVKDVDRMDGCTAIGSRYAMDNGGYYAEIKVCKTGPPLDASGSPATGFVGLGFTTQPAEAFNEQLPGKLCEMPNTWLVSGPYEKEDHMSLFCNGKLNLRFVYAHARDRSEQTMNYQVGDSIGLWIRRRDGKAKQWLLSVFINKNRIFTCNCNIPDGIEHFRIISECGGRVEGVKLLTNAHPPARLALNYWYNPLKQGAQRIIENILFVDESCAKKHPLKVDWTMSMSPCNISHTETKKCKILTWGNETIATPLTRLPDLDKSLALKCSKMILVLMANRVLEANKEPNSDERAKIAYTLFWYFKHRQCLRDEILLFVIKQLTENPARKSTLFGYVLLQILMEGAIEANYHLPILLDDFLQNQKSSDAKINKEIQKTRELFADVHDKFTQQYVSEDVDDE
ncbi:unnamed protein product [Amoebophrya sp. A25]|nr:unnamed protein product [Amoebophrya sp. A25]|eukprot:GSA25T00013932001.1